MAVECEDRVGRSGHFEVTMWHERWTHSESLYRVLWWFLIVKVLHKVIAMGQYATPTTDEQF